MQAAVAGFAGASALQDASAIRGGVTPDSDKFVASGRWIAGVGFQKDMARPARSQVKDTSQPPTLFVGHPARQWVRAGREAQSILANPQSSQEASKIETDRGCPKALHAKTHRRKYGQHRCPTGLALHLPRSVDPTSAPAPVRATAQKKQAPNPQLRVALQRATAAGKAPVAEAPRQRQGAPTRREHRRRVPRAGVRPLGARPALP